MIENTGPEPRLRIALGGVLCLGAVAAALGFGLVPGIVILAMGILTLVPGRYPFGSAVSPRTLLVLAVLMLVGFAAAAAHRAAWF